MVAMREVSPDGGDEQQKVAENDDGSTTKLDRKTIGHETTDSDGEDRPAQPSIEGVVGHVPFFRHCGVARGYHRAPSANNGGIQGDDEQRQIFLPSWPVEGIPGRFAGLRNENNVRVTSLGVLQSSRVTAFANWSIHKRQELG